MSLQIIPLNVRLLIILAFFGSVCEAWSVPGQSIIVQKNEAQFNYQSITFTLAAKSAADIDRITLIHGVNSNTCLSEVQARREVEFEAGAQVEAKWTWDLTRSGNLPPGATIWWQWELHDKNNTMQVTDRQTLKLEDKNYQWQKLASPSIALLWAKGGQDFGAQLLRSADNALQRLSKEAGVKTSAPVRVIIYPSEQKLQEALIRTSDWAGGVAFPEYQVVMIGIAPDQMDWAEKSIPHELAHLIVSMRIFNCAGNDMPAWLSEGLADYAAGPTTKDVQESITAALKAGSLPALTSLANGFAVDTQVARQSYDQSHMVVEFMIQHYGVDAIDKLLDGIRDGRQIDTALQEVYGLDTAGLDKTWRASLGVGSPPPANLASATQAASPTWVPTLALFSPFSTKTAAPSLTPIPVALVDTPIPQIKTAAPITLATTTPQQPDYALRWVALGMSGLLIVIIWLVVMLLRRKR